MNSINIVKENVNLSVLLFYIFLIITFDYIFFVAFTNGKHNGIYSIIIIFVTIVLEIITLLNFNENGVEITYKLKKLKKEYKIINVKKVGISYSQRNSMNNINFYFDDNSKISLPTSEKEDLKKTYRFFKDKNIECKVVGLPSGRTPADYNW
jgi:hypothetical protein